MTASATCTFSFADKIAGRRNSWRPAPFAHLPNGDDMDFGSCIFAVGLAFAVGLLCGFMWGWTARDNEAEKTQADFRERLGIEIGYKYEAEAKSRALKNKLDRLQEILKED
jgi:hypothetical protein